MLIKSPADLESFKKMYGIDEEIAKEYGYEYTDIWNKKM